MMNISSYLRIKCFSVLIPCILFSCKHKTSNEPELNDAENVIPNSFVAFYNEFHSDSLYQVEHIIFPLDGQPEMMDTIVLKYTWKKSDWAIQGSIDADSEFQQSFEIVDDNIIEDYIIHKTTGYGIFRRFSKISGEWYLIYYIGMNAPEVFQ